MAGKPAAERAIGMATAPAVRLTVPFEIDSLHWHARRVQRAELRGKISVNEERKPAELISVRAALPFEGATQFCHYETNAFFLTGSTSLIRLLECSGSLRVSFF